MVRNGFQTQELGTNEDLFIDLLPLLANRHADWDNVADSRKLKNSKVWTKSLTLLKNERNAEGDRLNKKVICARAAIKDEESDENSSDGKPQVKKTTPLKEEKAFKGQRDQPQVNEEGPLPIISLEVNKQESQDKEDSKEDFGHTLLKYETLYQDKIAKEKIRLNQLVDELKINKRQFKELCKELEELRQHKKTYYANRIADSE